MFRLEIFRLAQWAKLSRALQSALIATQANARRIALSVLVIHKFMRRRNKHLKLMAPLRLW